MCLLACAMGILVNRYLSSTMGHLSPAIRDNEIRVEYLGVSVQRTINVKFVIAGALAGGGGAITAIAVGHVDPDAMVYWLISGEFVFVTIFAGTGSVAAPFLDWPGASVGSRRTARRTVKSETPSSRCTTADDAAGANCASPKAFVIAGSGVSASEAFSRSAAIRRRLQNRYSAQKVPKFQPLAPTRGRHNPVRIRRPR